jgi:hypothetical protein
MDSAGIRNKNKIGAILKKEDREAYPVSGIL